MTYSLERFRADLAPFSDIGVEPPTFTEEPGYLSASLVRNGQNLHIRLNLSDGIASLDLPNEANRKFLNFRSLLASEYFADLSRWAASQASLLERRFAEQITSLFPSTPTESLQNLDSLLLPINVEAEDGKEGNLGLFDDVLKGTPSDLTLLDSTDLRTSIVLLDGPAGIGKTNVIERLAYERAREYRQVSRPLLLHVESRGRVLQNVNDLIAFSIQTLRVPVMYDQIPTLVRHGLIVLAIDGFDELGDPNGYKTAWAQLNRLIEDSRGRAQIVLAGRETFIGRKTVIDALSAVRVDDELKVISVRPVSPSQARNWLKNAGWSDSDFENAVARELLSDGSYALRPYFISRLSDPAVRLGIKSGEFDNPIQFLIEMMNVREARKFGEEVEALTSESKRRHFVADLMREVARELADTQAAAISDETLGWMAEMTAEELDLDPSIVGILKNRAGVVAFLTNDSRIGYKRFVNEQVQSFFAAHGIFQAVCDGELPKYLRRNILGFDFLEVFSDFLDSRETAQIKKFNDEALKLISGFQAQDRSEGNLASLMICCACASDDRELELKQVHPTECFMFGVPNARFTHCSISQLVTRAADLSHVSFLGDCSITTLVTDTLFVPPVKFPTPSRLVLPTNTLVDPGEIKGWLASQLGAEVKSNSLFDLAQRNEVAGLLLRFVRNRSYWIKEDSDEVAAKRILQDPHWLELLDLLRKHELVDERAVQSSGNSSKFYRLRLKDQFLDEEPNAPNVRKLFQEIA